MEVSTIGRPSLYSQDVAEEICRRLESGENLLAICRDENLPAESTVRKWAIENREGFSAMYSRARQVMAERWIDEIVSIADEATAENYNPARLRVDTRKWIASKVLPKVYGDAMQLRHADADGNQLRVEVTRVQPRRPKTIDVTPTPALPAPGDPSDQG